MSVVKQVLIQCIFDFRATVHDITDYSKSSPILSEVKINGFKVMLSVPLSFSIPQDQFNFGRNWCLSPHLTELADNTISHQADGWQAVDSISNCRF